jgi:pilus assembly protein FimV
MHSYALGAGNTSLHSQLGEKLLVEIALIGTDELSDEQILVGLAEIENYDRLGVEFNHLHRSLEFKIVRNENNEGILIVTSKEPITEPFLNFVLHIKTPQSGIIKEFSLLLDTPSAPNK